MDVPVSVRRKDPVLITPIKNRPFIKPFVTATPLDFIREREFLAEKIFPELDELCRLRGSHFLPTDLRYNDTEANAQSGALTKLSLDTITRCSPFFICLLGERYGYHRDNNASPLQPDMQIDDNMSWIDKNLLVAASSAYRWVLDDVQQFSSLTELEIIHATFINDADYSFFYFRRVDHIDVLYLDEEPEKREKLLEIYNSESEHAGLKQRDLKQRIVKRGLSVKYFDTLELLGNMVLKDWTAVIDLLCPPLLDIGYEIGSQFFKESLHSEAVAADESLQFVSNFNLENLMAEFTHHVTTANCDVIEVTEQESLVTGLSYTTRMRRKARSVPPDSVSILVLAGARGCGKSTLLAHWLQQSHVENKDVKLIRHFVGGSRCSHDVCAVMWKGLLQLWMIHGLDPTPGDRACLHGGHIGLEYSAVSQALIAAATRAPTVVVIDGVDQLTGCEQFTLAEIKELCWLPTRIPANVKFILTTSLSDATYVHLSNRTDVRVITFSDVHDLTVKEAIFTDNLSAYATVVPKDCIELIVDSKLSDSPLFLKMVAMEFRSPSVYERAADMTEEYCDVISIRQLWTIILKRWIIDLSWLKDGVRAKDALKSPADFEFLGWVADALRLLAVSKQGLSQFHLLRCLHRLGYQGVAMVTDLDWTLLMETGHFAFVQKSGPLIWFRNQQMKESVDYVLLGNFMGDIGTQYQDPMNSDSCNVEGVKCRNFLLDYYYNLPHSQERTEELLFQAEILNDWDLVYDLVTDHRVFLSMVADDAQPSRRLLLRHLWVKMSSAGFDVIAAYNDVIRCAEEGQTMKNKSQRILDPNALVESATFLTEIESQPVASNTSPMTPASQSELMYHVALFIYQLNHLNEAREILIQANHLLTKSYPISNDTQLFHCLIQEELGLLYSSEIASLTKSDTNAHIAMVTECFIWYQKALSNVDALVQISPSRNKTLLEIKGRILNRIGSLYVQSGDLSLAQQVLSQSEACLDIACCVVEKALCLYNMATLCRLMDKVKDAKDYYEKCLDVRQRWLGRGHLGVADVLLQLAQLCADQRNVDGYNRDKAELLFRKAIQMREDALPPTSLQVAEAVLGLGLLLAQSGSLSYKIEAVALLQRAMDSYIICNGWDFPECKRIAKTLKELTMALTLGLYDHGPAKAKNKRHGEFLYSCLSRRGDELRLLDQGREQRAKSPKSREAATAPVQMKLDDAVVEVTDADDTKVVSRAARSRLPNTSASTAEQISRPRFHGKTTLRPVSVDVKLIYPSQSLRVDSAAMSTPKTIGYRDMVLVDTRSLRLTSADGKRSPVDLTNEDAGTVSPEVDIMTSPGADDRRIMSRDPTPSPYLDSFSLPHERRTYERQFARIKARPKSAPVEIPPEKFTLLRLRETSPIQERGRNSQMTSRMTSRVTSAKSYLVHQNKCRLPDSESIRTCDAQPVVGPHSNLLSLLGHQRPQSGTGIRHKSAWYHVPGRYPISPDTLPPRRKQLFSRARDLSSKGR